MVQILHAKRELRDVLAEFSAEDNIFHTPCSTPPSVQTTTGRT